METLPPQIKKATLKSKPNPSPIANSAPAKSLPASPLQFALDYAKRGYPVLPLHIVKAGFCSCGKTSGCKPGKHPIAKFVPNGVKNATTNPSIIRTWWTKWPDANIGIRTGAVSGLIVLDVDPRHGGHKTLAAWEAEHGKLPETLEAHTGGGGRHICFKHPGGKIGCRSGIRPGLDSKGDQGYIVVAPSIHESGNSYQWKKWPAELADAPPSLLELLRSPTSPSAAVAGAQLQAKGSVLDHGPILDGQRNASLTSLAGTMRRSGFTLAAIVAALLSENAARCKPPLPEDEVKSIARSVAQYPPAAKRSRPEPPEPWQPVPLKALPDPVRAYIVQGAAALACDPAFIAVPMLAAMAGAVGNSRIIRVKQDWNEPSVVWSVVVAPSGTVKSPALDLAMKHLRARQKEWLTKHREAVDLYEKEMKHFGAASPQGHKPTKNIALMTKKLDRPKEPVARRLLCSDTTVEALAILLFENSRGLLVDRDELNGFFNSFGQYKQGRGGDDAHWLTMHGARQLMVDRKTGPRRMTFVARAAVSIGGTIQPAVLRRSLTRALFESGMAARFLFAMPPRAIKKWNTHVVAPEIDTAMGAIFDNLLALDFDPDAPGDCKPIEMSMTKKATQMMGDFYNQQAAECAALADDTVVAALSKLEGGACRLALLIHLARVAADAPGVNKSCVDAVSIEAGITLSRWFAREARRVYAVLRQSEPEHREHILFEFLGARGGKTTVRDLMRACPSSYPVADDAHDALNALVEGGIGKWVKVIPKGGGGRPSQEFRLVEKPPEDQA